MTRKDYQIIAKVVNNSSDCFDEISKAFLIMNFADELKLENPRFDLGRFTEACGMPLEELNYIVKN